MDRSRSGQSRKIHCYSISSGRAKLPTRAGRFVRALLVVLVLVGLAVGGYAAATELFSQPPGQNLTNIAVNVVLYPMLVIQVGLSLAALGLTISAVSEERSRLTWDNLRATPGGAGLVLRTRWAAVFYRLRGLLGLIVGVRLLLIVGVLYDLTAFQGRYLDLLVGSIEPSLPAALGPVPLAVPLVALLLSMFLAAALLLPFTSVAFNAAAGLLLSTLLRQRIYTSVVQFLIFMLRVAAVGALVWLVLGFQDNVQLLPAWQAWLGFLSFSVFADWGLMLLELGFMGELWALVPYGVFIPPLLLVYVLVQAFLAKVLLGWAVRTGQSRE